ncbi:MAG: CAP domain-containing protein [Rhodobacteraceae bacterium]|nr:CAP domain-containing protein [Paracoccaceae bacterium]
MLRTLTILLALAAGPAVACQNDMSVAREVVAATNNYRANLGRGALSLDSELTRAALRHACELKTTGRFSHRGVNGSRVGDRASSAGYRWRYIAENIASGQRSPYEVMVAWKNSAGHNRTLLNTNGQDIGVAAVRSGRSIMWVMVLGAPR